MAGIALFGIGVGVLGKVVDAVEVGEVGRGGKWQGVEGERWNGEEPMRRVEVLRKRLRSGVDRDFWAGSGTRGEENKIGPSG